MIRQLTRFAGVGAAATLVHVIVALFFSAVLEFPPQAANGAGFLAAVTFSYLGHGQFTFAAQLEHRFHAPRFLAASGLGLVLSSTITHVMTAWLDAPFAWAMGIVAVAVPVATFVLFKIWVFADAQPDGP